MQWFTWVTIAFNAQVPMPKATFVELAILRTCYLGTNRSDWKVLIYSEILFMSGLVWPANSDKKKTPDFLLMNGLPYRPHQKCASYIWRPLTKTAFTFGARAWCPSTVLARHWCEHTLFSSTHTRIRARCRCPRTRSRPCTRAQKRAPGPCEHTIFVSSGQSTALFSLLGSCFKMASDWAKWSSYVHSLISDTQSVNTAPFCAGTQALVPEHQVWPSVDSPSPFKIIFLHLSQN